MTIADVKSRLAGLRNGLANLEREQRELTARINLQAGSVAECEHWLGLLEEQADNGKDQTVELAPLPPPPTTPC